MGPKKGRGGRTPRGGKKTESAAEKASPSAPKETRAAATRSSRRTSKQQQEEEAGAAAAAAVDAVVAADDAAPPASEAPTEGAPAPQADDAPEDASAQPPEPDQAAAATETPPPAATETVSPEADASEADAAAAEGAAAAVQEEDAWVEGVDPASGVTYWFNTVTQLSTWERPAVLGDAPPRSSKRAKLEVDFDKPLTREAAGRIIGRGGGTIRTLQANSGARIEVDRHTNAITFSGTPAAVALAKKLAIEVLDGSFNDQMPVQQYTVMQEGVTHSQQPLADPVDLDKPLPKNVIGRIIGRGGETIKALQNSSGCRIHVDRESRMLSMTGDDKAVKKARGLIEELLMGASQTVHKHADYGAESIGNYMGYMSQQYMMMAHQQQMLYNQQQWAAAPTPSAAPPVPASCAEHAKGTVLLIKGLPSAFQEEHLRAAFAPFGKVAVAEMCAPPFAGHAFVAFAAPAEAQAAQSTMDSFTLGASTLRVSLVEQ